MFALQKSNKKVSARKQIAIKGVRDGILLLPNHQHRLILQVSAINFELKSDAEQDALIETYQSFLNSLGSSIQIVVRVREMDMDKYLESFSSRLAGEKQATYKDQLKNYTHFVRSLISVNKILARNFYIVIPNEQSENDFEIVKEHLLLNADIVTKGMSRLGMHTKQLTSLEVLDLFYSFYNPGQAKRQPITERTMELLNRSYV